MLTVFKTGHSIHRIIIYNENKVKESTAGCIFAVNYSIGADNLSFTHKLNRLLHHAALNENVSRNSVHISLNFDPSEKLSDKKLQEIYGVYMEKLDSENNRFLLY